MLSGLTCVVGFDRQKPFLVGFDTVKILQGHVNVSGFVSSWSSFG